MPGEHVVHTEETSDGLHVHGDQENAPAESAGGSGSAQGDSGSAQEPLD
jgi:hypothetical protein